MIFSENSRVWIYQSDKQLSDTETAALQQQLNSFTTGWTAHNSQLKAKAEIRYNRFIIFTVDESQAGVTGCSIDKSVALMKALEQHLHINLFDRFNIAYRTAEGVTSVPRLAFEELIKQGAINADTIVFNNLVNTLKDIDTKWEVPYKNSWHKQVFGNLVTA